MPDLQFTSSYFLNVYLLVVEIKLKRNTKKELKIVLLITITYKIIKTCMLK